MTDIQKRAQEYLNSMQAYTDLHVEIDSCLKCPINQDGGWESPNKFCEDHEQKEYDLPGCGHHPAKIIQELTAREAKAVKALEGILDWDALEDKDFEGDQEAVRYIEITKIIKKARSTLTELKGE